jgi:hypothetical protein
VTGRDGQPLLVYRNHDGFDFRRQSGALQIGQRRIRVIRAVVGNQNFHFVCHNNFLRKGVCSPAFRRKVSVAEPFRLKANGVKLRQKAQGELPIANWSLPIISQEVWLPLPAKQLAMTNWQWAMA